MNLTKPLLCSFSGDVTADAVRWWVRQAMSRALSIYARTIRLPISTYDLLYRIHRTTAELLSETGRTPTPQELANTLEIPLRRLQQVLDTVATTECVSSDIPTGDDQNSTIIDLLSYEAPERDLLPPAADLPTFLEGYTNPERSAAALARLDPTEHEVIQALFFDDRTTRTVWPRAVARAVPIPFGCR